MKHLKSIAVALCIAGLGIFGYLRHQKVRELEFEIMEFRGVKAFIDPIPRSKIDTGLKALYLVEQNESEVYLPFCYKFEADKVGNILSTGIGTEKECDGFLAYPIVDDTLIKVVIAPYYFDRDSNILLYYNQNDPETIGAHNYSDICPGVACALNQSTVLTIPNPQGAKTYKFRGVR